MAKQISIKSKNGAKEIDRCRQETNVSNLNDELVKWQTIVSIIQTSTNIKKTLTKKGEVRWKYITTKIDSKISSVLTTIYSRIAKNHSYRGFASVEDIKFSDLQRMASTYLSADPWLQIDYCRNATRQGVDELVQAKILATYVNNTFKTITNGKEVPFNGKLVSKKEAQGLNKKQLNARSVDTTGTVGLWRVKVFQKFAAVSGSGQSAQTLEVQNWLEECIKIKDANMLFVAQLDGAEAESHILELRNIIKQHSNIFVGNSEQVIDFLNSIK